MKIKGNPQKPTATDDTRGGVSNNVVADQICHLQQDTKLMRIAIRELTEISKSMLEVQQRQEAYLHSLNESIDNVEESLKNADVGIANMDKDLDVLIKLTTELLKETKEHSNSMVDSTTKFILALHDEATEKRINEQAIKIRESKDNT